jgi:3-isopropylmalate/(R)-2-methylmalate dehydratase small subunit
VAGASLSGAGQYWELELAAGPRQMLASGQWDATGQLVANAEALQATVQRLPYLQGFTSL